MVRSSSCCKPTRKSLSDFHAEMESLLNHVCGPGTREHSGEFVPRMDVAETEGEYEISVDLPGLDPGEVKVELDEGQLSISSEIKQQEKVEGKRFHRVERRFGPFRRSISLPETVDHERIGAEFKHGVLTVKLPKTEKVKPKKIEVKSVD